MTHPNEPARNERAHDAGLASALVAAAQQLGGGIGAALLNALAGAGRSEAPAGLPHAAALAGGHRVAVAGGAVLLVAAALRAWRLPRSPPSAAPAAPASR